jgi:hypothetical protein
MPRSAMRRSLRITQRNFVIPGANLICLFPARVRMQQRTAGLSAKREQRWYDYLKRFPLWHAYQLSKTNWGVDVKQMGFVLKNNVIKWGKGVEFWGTLTQPLQKTRNIEIKLCKTKFQHSAKSFQCYVTLLLFLYSPVTRLSDIYGQITTQGNVCDFRNVTHLSTIPMFP